MELKGAGETIATEGDDGSNADDEEGEYPIPSVKETATKIWNTVAMVDINLEKKAQREAEKEAREPGAQWKGPKVRFEFPAALKAIVEGNPYVEDWAPSVKDDLRAGFLEGPYPRAVAIEIMGVCDTMEFQDDPSNDEEGEDGQDNKTGKGSRDKEKFLAAQGLLTILNDTFPSCEFSGVEEP